MTVTNRLVIALVLLTGCGVDADNEAATTTSTSTTTEPTTTTTEPTTTTTPPLPEPECFPSSPTELAPQLAGIPSNPDEAFLSDVYVAVVRYRWHYQFGEAPEPVDTFAGLLATGDFATTWRIRPPGGGADAVSGPVPVELASFDWDGTPGDDGAVQCLLEMTADLPPSNPSTISAEEFGAISTGMSLAEVEAIIGGTGELLSSTEIAGITGEIYSWNGEGGVGANANVQFQDGAVIGKAQFGLGSDG